MRGPETVSDESQRYWTFNMTQQKTMVVRLAESVRRALGYRMPRLGRVANAIFFRLLPRVIDSELFPGIRIVLDLSQPLQRTTYWQGKRFERPTPQLLAAWGGAKATAFFDIGANYGFYSFWMLWQCRHLDVYAFEPNAENFAVMESTKERNSLRRFRPVDLGLGDREEVLPLHLANADSGHSTFGNHPGLAQAPCVEAPVVPFDVWLHREGIAMPEHPSWIAKIDVEGFEPKVISGMRRSLLAKAFLGIVVEINPYTLAFCDAQPNDVVDFMADHGYVTGPSQDVSFAESKNVFFVPEQSGTTLTV